MPLYAYRCEAGHTFEKAGKMDGSDAPKKCQMNIITSFTFGEVRPDRVCGAPVQKILAAPARVFPGADSWRR